MYNTLSKTDSHDPSAMQYAQYGSEWIVRHSYNGGHKRYDSIWSDPAREYRGTAELRAPDHFG